MADVFPLPLTLTAPPARKRRRDVPRLCVDAKALARALGLGLRTVRALDATGRLPEPFKLGGRKLWNLAELRSWISAGAPGRAEWEARKSSNRT